MGASPAGLIDRFSVTYENGSSGSAWEVGSPTLRLVIGAAILLLAMLVVLPSALFAAGAAWSALLGGSLNSQAMEADVAAQSPGA